MDFRLYLEMTEEMDLKGASRPEIDMKNLPESWRASRRALLAGAMGAAVAAPFIAGPPDASRAPAPIYMGSGTADFKRISEKMKDQGRYYDAETQKRLRTAAEEGDEWAARELPWPKNHRLHKMGRPFQRNSEPHPQGLFPHSGY